MNVQLSPLLFSSFPLNNLLYDTALLQSALLLDFIDCLLLLTVSNESSL